MNSVIKGTGYALVHTPNMVIEDGVTASNERVLNPESEYLKELPKHLRSYEDAVAYYPNQIYIGNESPEVLDDLKMPWCDHKPENAKRHGPWGEIMPEEEFYLLMQICDEFDLIQLDKDFVAAYRDQLASDPIITEYMMSRLAEGKDAAEIKKLIEEDGAERIMDGDKIVGCVKRAHEIDACLQAHVMLENIACKASGVLALLYSIKDAGLNPEDIDYVIDCAEEACGDANQRGGGSLAKAMAEICQLNNATGHDTRTFCAAPAHAIVEAASLVKAGAFKHIAVVGGGCTAKLGMNSKDHIKKDLPVLEDCLGGVSVIVSENDGVSPEIDLEHLGVHTVGTGSAPQAVIGALIAEPLEKMGLSTKDVDKYSPEMQNPDITKPAGAGNVPEANFKMIAALSVKKGWLDRTELKDFVQTHGVNGYAPTQGHIPSGVPYVGFGRRHIMDGSMQRVMIIGKGSLFLGRLTNLFDGVSFMMIPNSGESAAESSVSKDTIRQIIAESLRDFAANLVAENTEE